MNDVDTGWWHRLRRRKGLSLLLDVALIILVMLALHAWQTRDLPDEQVPETVLALLDGNAMATAVVPGKSGVVYFFAPWCFYCKHSIGNLDTLVADGRVGWGRVIALDYDSADEVREFIDQSGVQLPVLLGSRQTAADWSIRAFPTYYVIDADGRISSRSVGYSTWLGMWARAWLAG